MTRLSDLLRGAANRAPIGGASVSFEKARRRVHIRRGARVAANGLAGAGAVALLVVGVINPALSSKDNETNAPLSPLPSDDARTTDSLGSEGAAWYSDWGSCGSSIDTLADSSGFLTLAVDSEAWTDLNSGTTLDIPVSLRANDDVSILTSGAGAVLLYEGVVVSRLEPAQAEEALSLAAGEVADSTLSFPLVNCFDGAPLPAAKYELVVSQEYSSVQDAPSPSPTVGPTPSAEPSPPPSPNEPQPGPTPTGLAQEDRTTEDSAYLGASESDPAPPEVMEPPVWEYREIAPVATVSIAGDPVEDPFGDYLWSPPDKPSDILTPQEARDLYSAALVSKPWDMAPGTSRWIIPSYETFEVDELALSSSRVAPSAWYGCSWDGTTGAAFPAQSADLGLLDVSATFPSRINLSYGWVVDGNPEVHLTVTNTSDYSLPGFYGEPNHSLYLVQDGRVVAQAWPESMYPYASYSDHPDVQTPVAANPDEYWGTLPPGNSLTGDYLWRDLSECWTGSGPVTVGAGTYTLLSSQTIYVEGSRDPGILYTGIDDVIAYEGDGTSTSIGIAPPPAVDFGEAGDKTAVEPQIEPGSIDPGDSYDWVEFQVWTSLGTVTITTS